MGSAVRKLDARGKVGFVEVGENISERGRLDRAEMWLWGMWRESRRG